MLLGRCLACVGDVFTQGVNIAALETGRITLQANPMDNAGRWLER